MYYKNDYSSIECLTYIDIHNVTSEHIIMFGVVMISMTKLEQLHMQVLLNCHLAASLYSLYKF